MSPPTPQLFGCAPASTALVATAASAAVPPALSTSTPASVASGWAEATMPSWPRATGRYEYPSWGTGLTSREELGDLVLGKDRQWPFPGFVHEHDAAVPRDRDRKSTPLNSSH